MVYECRNMCNILQMKVSKLVKAKEKSNFLWVRNSLTSLCNQSLTVLKNGKKARQIFNFSLSQRYTRYEATHVANPSERNSEVKWVMDTHWANEQIPSLKQPGQAAIHSCHEPHPYHSAIWLGRNPHLPDYPWGVKHLDCISSASAFKVPLYRLPNIYFWNQRGLACTRNMGL